MVLDTTEPHFSLCFHTGRRAVAASPLPWLGLVQTPALSLQSAWMQMARAPWLPTKDNIDIDEVFSCAQ